MKELFKNASESFKSKNKHLGLLPHEKRLLAKLKRMPRGILNDHETTTERQISDPKPEPALRHEPLGTAQRKKTNPSRCVLRITSYRCRLLDVDNLCPKYFIDALRYCRAIRGDAPTDIELQIRQEKVAHKCQQMTLIEVEI